MVVQKTSRLGLEKYTEGSDTHPNRAKFNSERDVLDALTAIGAQGVTSARPLPGAGRRFFWDTTVKRLFWDDGAAWHEVTTNGGGGAGQPVVPGAAAVEGVSGRSARADHTHLLALVTSSVDGAMRKLDKAKLDAATSDATPSTLVWRGTSGQFFTPTPTFETAAANKNYVDVQVGTRAPTSHTHTVSQLTDMTSTGEALAKTTSATAARSTLGLNNVNNTTDAAKPVSTATQSALNGKSDTGHPHSGADITSGLINQARIANATTTLNGLMSAADKATLDGATAGSAGDTIVKRGSTGETNFNGVYLANSPVSGSHATRKDYVDGKTWSGADITSGLIDQARIANATSALNGLMSSADKAKLDNAGPSPLPNTLMMTASNGMFTVATPTAASHPASKGYVDGLATDYASAGHTHSWGQISGKPTTFTPSSHTHSWSETTGKPTTFTPSNHNHDASDITSGLINQARIANVSSSLNGLMSAADKIKLDAASSTWAANTLMMTNSAGQFNVAPPTESVHATNKGYVDGEINGRAASNHTHSWSQVTGKPSTFAPSSHSHSWGETTGKPSTFTPSSHTHSWGQISGKPTILGYAELDARYPQKSHNHWWSDITRTEVIYNTNAGWGSYRAVWVNSDGAVGYNLSSRKYKANERAYEPDARLLDVVEPKWFQYTKEIDEQGQAAPWRVNFIAEDLHNAGLTEYVSYDGKGTSVENAETINEQLIVNALWAFAKQQRTQISELTKRLDTMDAA